MILIAQGAEARVYEDGDTVVKERVSKSYRIPEIDTKITRSRTRKEAKTMAALAELKISVPRLIKVEENRIYMERIPGNVLKHSLNDTNYLQLMHDAGEMVARMHNAGIIHGDLTTLNFILGNKLYLIDFGLSFNSLKDEDKAVDLYVLERAIRCAHSDKYTVPFYRGYAVEGSAEVLKRLESVRLRGRKREENATG